MKQYLSIFIFLILISTGSNACSILYYIDSATGKIYAVNNEDYWYDVKASLTIEPANKHELARLWYGWDNFAQGGINSAGLFFDGASTPEQEKIEGYSRPRGNLGDAILAVCKTTEEALAFIEKKRIMLTNGHLLFGDRSGNAVVVEWTNGRKNIIRITDNKLIITNFLLADTARGNYPCPRYMAMEAEIERLRNSNTPLGLKEVGNIVSRAVQIPNTNQDGRKGGTIYSTFIDITDMQFKMIPKLDNSKGISLDLRKEFSAVKSRTIKIE